MSTTPLVTLSAVLAALAGTIAVTDASDPGRATAQPAVVAPTGPAATRAPLSSGAAPRPRPDRPARRVADLAPAVLAGRSGDTTMALALRRDRSAVAYVCDGAAVEAWFSGRVTERAALRGSDGVLTLRRTPQGIRAVFSQRRHTWEFDLRRAPVRRNLDDDGIRRLALDGLAR